MVYFTIYLFDFVIGLAICSLLFIWFNLFSGVSLFVFDFCVCVVCVLKPRLTFDSSFQFELSSH